MTSGETKILQIKNGATEKYREKLAFYSTLAVEMGVSSDCLIESSFQ